VRRLTQFIVHVFSLRTLVLLVAVWMLARGPLPNLILQWREQVQVHLFRLGLHLSDLPLPQTHITVIHVPDIEYERWLVDLPGAGTLEQLFAKTDQGTLIGLILEQPLVLVQPHAEGLLQEIQQGRRQRDHLYPEVATLLARRESLVNSLTSSKLVLGLTDQSSHFYRRIPVQESFQEYPQPLRDWLWPWPKPSPTPVVSPVLPYFPIDSAPSQERRLASLEGDKVIPMFPLQFWAASQGYRLPSTGPQALHWQRDRGFALGVEHIPTSVGAEIVPLYGAFSGIRASMRQITLGAALAGGELSGWILLGRDSSPTLEQSAQVIASLGDRAFLFEPAWWVLVQKTLLAGAAVCLIIVLPMLSLRRGLVLAVIGLVGLGVAQIAGQTLGGFWLPVGEPLLFSASGLVVMLLWRWQRAAWRRQQERADSACQALADAAVDAGHLADAWRYLRSCRASASTLERLYHIAELYELRGDFTQALAVLRDLRRRRFRYRDVSQRIKRLRACIVYQRDHVHDGSPADEEPAGDGVPH
jgi:hypothetical protein